MRELATQKLTAFNNGLRPTNRLGINKDYLFESKNAKPADDGLVPYEKIVVPFSSDTLTAAGITISFPFPQLFKGKGVTLLVTQDAIFTVDESDWSLTAITITGSITGSGVWHFIDMFDYWFLFNGTTVIRKTNVGALTGVTPTVIATQTPAVNTGTYSNGRALMGGFGSDFWSDDWKHVLDYWKQNLPPGFEIDPLMEQNFVLWSSIGGGNLLWLFDACFAVEGTMLDSERTVVQPKLFEYFKRNDMGFMPMPWQGAVQAMHPLGRSVIVYGDDGISALIQVTEPVPTYGIRHLIDVGVASRGAVGVSSKRHVFLDNAGFLWQIDTDLNLKRLNYQEYFIGYTSGDVVISHDQLEDEFYICNTTTNRILSSGLGEGNQAVSSVINVAGSLLGIADDLDDTSDNDQMIIVTDAFDLSVRGIKNISFIDLGIQTTDNITVAIDYLYNKGTTYERSDFVVVNDEGWCYVNVSGVTFRLVIKGDDFTLSKLSYANIRYKLEDKRGIRGINVSSTSSQ